MAWNIFLSLGYDQVSLIKITNHTLCQTIWQKTKTDNRNHWSSEKSLLSRIFLLSLFVKEQKYLGWIIAESREYYQML